MNQAAEHKVQEQANTPSSGDAAIGTSVVGTELGAGPDALADASANADAGTHGSEAEAVPGAAQEQLGNSDKGERRQEGKSGTTSDASRGYE